MKNLHRRVGGIGRRHLQLHRPVQQGHHLVHPYFPGGQVEGVAAFNATPTLEQAPVFQSQKDLLEKFFRDARGFRHLRDLVPAHPALRTQGYFDKGSDAIFAFLGKFHPSTLPDTPPTVNAGAAGDFILLPLHTCCILHGAAVS